MTQATASVGELVRSWREQRHLSQLDLASEAEISQKHLSFIESGRAAPSREMVLHLAEHLEVPLRDRNVMLLAAGFSPIYGGRSLQDPMLIHAKASAVAICRAARPAKNVSSTRTPSAPANNHRQIFCRPSSSVSRS